MKLSKRDRQRTGQALRIAIDDRECLIDAHTTEVYFVAGHVRHRVPKGLRGDVKVFTADVKAFRKLLSKLNATQPHRRSSLRTSPTPELSEPS